MKKTITRTKDEDEKTHMAKVNPLHKITERPKLSRTKTYEGADSTHVKPQSNENSSRPITRTLLGRSISLRNTKIEQIYDDDCYYNYQGCPQPTNTSSEGVKRTYGHEVATITSLLNQNCRCFSIFTSYNTNTFIRQYN